MAADALAGFEIPASSPAIHNRVGAAPGCEKKAGAATRRIDSVAKTRMRQPANSASAGG